MSTRETPWPDATPNWVELSTPDLEIARRFYQELFGWTVKDEQRDFADCYLDGRRVCGLASSAGPPDTGPPWAAGLAAEEPRSSAWISYFATSDAAAVLDRAHRAGGQVTLGPSPDGDRCVRAVATDPLGTVFGLWQAGSQIGAELVNEPGALIWNEHLSSNYQAVQPFYAEVLGWQYSDISVDGFHYSTCRVAGDATCLPAGDATCLPADERDIAGIGEPSSELLPLLAGRWLAYFATADTDASLDLLGRLGGGVILPATDTPHGRLAVVQDDQAAVFALLGPARQAH